MKLLPTRNYIIIKNIKELYNAKKVDLCRHIIYESNNAIYIWNKKFGKWEKEVYSMFGKIKEKDFETTGFRAYQEFYTYCGKNEIDRMKKVLPIIDVWDSYEQMHYANVDYAGQKIYKNIYEFDANGAFTYGALQLQDDFNLLKEYLLIIDEKKENALNDIKRSLYKNRENYLIGYFARIKEFVSLRSEIINNSNSNIRSKMSKIRKYKGNVYLSNTDSIVTDDIGADIMQQYIGTKAGEFKLKTKTDRLFYKSSNCYQLGDKVVYSGVKYFARKNTDFFSDRYAQQEGTLIAGHDFDFEYSDEHYKNICKVRGSEVTVKVYNQIGELVDIITYKGDIQC